MRNKLRLILAAGLALGVAGTFYFREHPVVRGCADPYYAGGACHNAANYSYSPGFYVSLALVGIVLFILVYRFLHRKNT